MFYIFSSHSLRPSIEHMASFLSIPPYRCSMRTAATLLHAHVTALLYGVVVGGEERKI